MIKHLPFPASHIPLGQSPLKLGTVWSRSLNVMVEMGPMHSVYPVPVNEIVGYFLNMGSLQTAPHTCHRNIVAVAQFPVKKLLGEIPHS